MNTTGHSVMHATEKISEDAVTASSGGAEGRGGEGRLQLEWSRRASLRR